MDMLLRIWMVMLMAVYPAYVGWMSLPTCTVQDGQVQMVCAAGQAAVPSCCGSPKAETGAKDRAPEPILGRGCCAARQDEQRDEASQGEEPCCPIPGYCRGPCRSTPSSPYAPLRPEHLTQASGAPIGEPSYPELAAVMPWFAQPANWAVPRVTSVSERLATICLRTI